MRDADSGAILEKIGKAKNLDQAIDMAQEYEESEIVEYGISFTKKQIKKND